MLLPPKGLNISLQVTAGTWNVDAVVAKALELLFAASPSARGPFPST
jgi:hypothetical protein